MLYVIFYIVYLTLIAIGLWFLLFYSNVPQWVWSFFAIAITLAIIGTILKEFFFLEQHHSWIVIYVFLYFIAFILIVVGLIFIMTYSTMPWWIWTPLLIALLLSILTEMIVELSPNLATVALFLAILTFITLVISLVILITHGQTPEWVWLIIGLSIIFFVLAGIFKGINYRHIMIQ